jgi:hypothetical protein
MKCKIKCKKWKCFTHMVNLYITNEFKIEIMYVYYIVMQIYVFCYMNIFSPFYYLCIISMRHHSSTMNFTWNTSKAFKTKISIAVKILFHETLDSYNLFVSSESIFFQRSQTPIYILTKQKLNNNFFKIYTSHDSQCDFTWCKDFDMTFT